MSHISSLYLFAKETDAVEAVKGFKFQELTTLEIWLSNKIKNIDEIIYCDHEEDIFQRDLKEFKATFTQLKLYSSKHFSFASEEVTKAIAHFFMLFVKGDYLMDKPVFVFETNSSIAGKYMDNDAELLKEWYDHQVSLSEDLLKRCVGKIKDIVDEYINRQYAKLKDKGSKEIEEAKAFYDGLPLDTWEAFAKSIRWVFTSTGADETIEKKIGNIKALIGRLPFPLSRDEQDLVFDKLRGIVSDRSMESNAENRRLTNETLVKALLEMGARDDKNYIKVLEAWKDVQKVAIFKIGEFYEALYAAKHCRRNKYLKEHNVIWIKILLKYYNHKDTPTIQKREALYEIVWSTLRPAMYKIPKASLKGLEQEIRKYFDELEHFKDSGSLEDCLNLLSVITSSSKLGLVDIENDEVKGWHDRYRRLLDELIGKGPEHDTLVELLELQAFLVLNSMGHGIFEHQDGLSKLEVSLNAIIDNLPHAEMFSVSQLGGRLDTIGELYFKMDIDTEESRLIEEFSERLMPFVKAQDSDTSTARGFIEKGIRSLDMRTPKSLIRALSFLHKGKDLYQNSRANEGFALSLLAISEFYGKLQMNMAAKYYGLGAVWYCMNASNPHLYRRISDGYAQLFSCDFRQGAWINALLNFESYVSIRNEVDPADFDPVVDEKLRTTLFQTSYILALAPKITAQLGALIEYEKGRMGSLYNDIMHEYVEVVGRTLKEDGITLQQFVGNKTDSPPVSDIGPERIITWKALGILWKVVFQNDFNTNSIAEEFSALMQVFMIDIIGGGVDLQLLKGEVIVHIEVSGYKAPEQLADNSKYEWKVFLPIIDSRDSGAINRHYAYISTSLKVILQELSLLVHEKFDEIFMSLLAKGGAKKALVVNAYQIMYRKIFLEESFTASQRQNFHAEILPGSPTGVAILELRSDSSNLYNNTEVLDTIMIRYIKTSKNLERTLARISGEADFQQKIQKFRDDGWLDWQILLGLQNHISNLKARNIMRLNENVYDTQEQEREEFLKIFNSIIKSKDEEHTYVEIPLQYILDDGLDMHMLQVPAYVLASYGLEGKSRFPNFEAIRSLLNDRFNFASDDAKELSPFKF